MCMYIYSVGCVCVCVCVCVYVCVCIHVYITYMWANALLRCATYRWICLWIKFGYMLVYKYVCDSHVDVCDIVCVCVNICIGGCV